MFAVPRRIIWLVSAALTVLLGISVLPASAWNGEADEPALYSACVGPALEDAGFTDIRRYPAATREAINCLAHYQITLGTSRSTFSPEALVPRKHLVLFLVRAAEPAGIDLPKPSARPAQGFTDVEGLSLRTREAIDQLDQLGITQGKTRSTFAPDAPVTRRQMALFLYRFLDLAPVGPGGIDVEDAFPDDRHFEDLYNQPLSVYDAVRTLFEMGVLEGTTKTTFSPSRKVTRAEMALALTRMLGHTNARPAGLTMQTDDVVVDAEADAEVVISVRDRWHRPVPDALVDMFEWAVPSTRRVDPFDTQGRCEEDQVRASFGNDPCVIDQSDDTTDADGNLEYDVFVDEDLTLWAWSGDLRDRFDLDRTRYESIEFTAVAPPDAFQVTDDLHPEAKKVMYGDSVTFTFQLVDEDGKPVRREDEEIEIQTEERSNGELAKRQTDTYYTDSGGEVTVRYRISRPRHGDSDTESHLEVRVLDSSGLDLVDKTAVKILGTTNGNENTLVWSRDAREPTTLVLSQTLAYHTAENSGARNRVTATLLDQYGDPVRGETVHFRSDDSEGLGVDATEADLAKENFRKPTSRRGEATVSYFRNSATAGTEDFNATNSKTFVEGETVEVKGMTKHYWVLPAPTGQTEGLLVLHDTRRRTFVYNETTPYRITYDSGDQFNHGTSTESYNNFLTNVKEGQRLSVVVTGHRASDTNRFTRTTP